MVGIPFGKTSFLQLSRRLRPLHPLDGGMQRRLKRIIHRLAEGTMLLTVALPILLLALCHLLGLLAHIVAVQVDNGDLALLVRQVVEVDGMFPLETHPICFGALLRHPGRNAHRAFAPFHFQSRIHLMEGGQAQALLPLQLADQLLHVFPRQLLCVVGHQFCKELQAVIAIGHPGHPTDDLPSLCLRRFGCLPAELQDDMSAACIHQMFFLGSAARLVQRFCDITDDFRTGSVICQPLAAKDVRLLLGNL